MGRVHKKSKIRRSRRGSSGKIAEPWDVNYKSSKVFSITGVAGKAAPTEISYTYKSYPDDGDGCCESGG